MSIIIPAVLVATKQELDATLERLVAIPAVDFVQIDVIDGRFAEPATWPYASGTKEFATMAASGETLPYYGRLKFEMDLMVSEPEEVTGTWITAGASRICVHAESTNYLPRVMTDLKHKYGHDKDFAPDLLSFGLALNIATDLALVEQYVDDIDYVQFMGIARIGRQGEPFDRRVLKKIELFKKRNPRVSIQVDGGVSLSSAPALLSVGVDRLVVGSALLKAPDLAEEFARFESLVQQYGIYEGKRG